jgi:hypothetical protein
MDLSALQDWLSITPLWLVALSVFGAMCAAGAAGIILQRRRALPESWEGQEGYIVSAALGMLALLMGFTFSLAVERFEARRYLVLDEANAIGTAYLRTQLLPEPHRARMSGILVRYTENRVALAKARPGRTAALLAANDALVTDMWAATAAAFDAVKGLDFSSAYLNSVNAVIDLDSSRKAARGARVPIAVFVVLLADLITTAGVLGYVMHGLRGGMAAAFLLVLLTVTLVLIIDIDRPTLGSILEGQGPMEALRKSLETQPPQVFDRWRQPPPDAVPALVGGKPAH